MQEATLLPFTTWQSFYVLIGTAAATLTGLMFVVVTVIAGGRGHVSSAKEAFTTFHTPNVWHFGTALLVSALLSAPWQEIWVAGLLLTFLGLGGISYILIVLRRMRQHQPVLEDWLFYTILPLVSYTALVVAALLLLSYLALALFVIAAVTVLLLFVGIHNAWDNVTYIAIAELSQSENKRQE